MAKFMYLLRGGHEASKHMAPDRLQEHMAEYFTWIEKLTKDGNFKQGEPLENEGRVVSGANGSVIKDGPFAETKEQVGGYFIIEADSLDVAAEIARGCPIYDAGGSVEVRAIADMTPG